MSTGLVVCKTCRREVHQNGPKIEINPGFGLKSYLQSTWLHCEDKTPACAPAVYPRTRSEIVGRVCGIDGPAPEDS